MCGARREGQGEQLPPYALALAPNAPYPVWKLWSALWREQRTYQIRLLTEVYGFITV